MAQTETCAVMNGFRNGNSSNSSPGFGSANSGTSEIKYPANCTTRFGSTGLTGLGFGASGETTMVEDNDKIYEPKQNKKIVRIVTVMGYIFSVSTVAILLSLYYLFLWNPYREEKGLTTDKPMVYPDAKLVFDSKTEPLFADQPETDLAVDVDMNSGVVEDPDGDESDNNPNDQHNKVQKLSHKNRGHSPTCRKCNE